MNNKLKQMEYDYLINTLNKLQNSYVEILDLCNTSTIHLGINHLRINKSNKEPCRKFLEDIISLQKDMLIKTNILRAVIKGRINILKTEIEEHYK